MISDGGRVECGLVQLDLAALWVGPSVVANSVDRWQQLVAASLATACHARFDSIKTVVALVECVSVSSCASI